MSDTSVIQVLNPWRGVRPFERHSLVLLVAGLVYIFVGGAFFFTPMTEARYVAFEYALLVFNMQGWGTVFVVSGLLSIISSRWPPISETWGYTVLTGISAGWAAFYVPSVWFGDAPSTNYVGTLTWGLMAFMWWAISGLINPKGPSILANEINMLQQENLALHQELALRPRTEE